MTDDYVVIELNDATAMPQRGYEVALDRNSLTAFLSWLESRPSPRARRRTSSRTAVSLRLLVLRLLVLWLLVLIALRFSRGRRRGSMVSLISVISTIGIALGVAVLIVGLSAMNGFERELNNRVLAVVPHGEIEPVNQPWNIHCFSPEEVTRSKCDETNYMVPSRNSRGQEEN